MHEVLRKADIETGEANSVPYSTMRGLKSRGLVLWPTDSLGVTRNGLPSFDRIKLTPAGIAAARTLSTK